MKNRELPEEAQVKIQLFLLSFRWASLLFALIPFLIYKNTVWGIVLIAVIYNISITVYLKFYAKDRLGGALLLFFDLVACIFLVIAGGYTITESALNPFFLYSFTSLLGIAFKYKLRDSFLTALLLSFSYYFALVVGSNEPLMKSEFIDTHIANFLSFFFVAAIITQVANALRSYSLDQAILNVCGQKDPISLIGNMDKLSSREKEVLSLLCRGKSNKEIAEVLFISENTAKKHTANIYKKLGLKGRVQLAERRKEE